MQEYALGFLHDDKRVVMIRKNRPDWQAGKLNGVGGHVEPGENAYQAMVREFKEETGVDVPLWDHFLTLRGKRSLISCYATYDTENYIKQVKTLTDEKVVVVNLKKFNYDRAVPNVSWILPLMQQRDGYFPIVVSFHGE